jgi:dTDP-4-amino-4,6-dideoxygalactose transaminase
MKFLDLNKQYREVKTEVDSAIRGVFERSDFILGREVKLFEEEFARYCKTKYAVGVNSGTGALFLALKSLDIQRGDEVIIPVFTFIATAFAVSYAGAKPVFVDVDENTYCLDVKAVEKVITKRTKAIIPVHLYGHPAEMKKILDIAKGYNLKVIEDAAQAHGAVYNYHGSLRKVGSMGDMGCFSFYPTKNLGACGDAGAIVTNNKKIYQKLMMLRDCGRVSKYEHAIIGYNARLDTLQAAILRAKLRNLDRWNRLRQEKARLYTKLLSDVGGVILPSEEENAKHVYHLYVIRVKNRKRLCRILKKHHIPFLIHYPIPLHLQKAYKNLGYKKGDFPVAETIAGQIMSLPMYPHLEEKEIKLIAHILKDVFKG